MGKEDLTRATDEELQAGVAAIIKERGRMRIEGFAFNS